MKVSIHDDLIEVQVGRAHASAPLDELEALIHILRGSLEGARLLPRRAAPAVEEGGAEPKAPSPPEAPKPPKAAAPRRRKAASPKPVAAKTDAAKTDAAKTDATGSDAAKTDATGSDAAKTDATGSDGRAPTGSLTKPATPKRKSRKRVGEALVDWMRENPGWHSTETLLRTVVDNHITDANPKLAVTIALGKQKGKLFETDDKGHWKLAGEDAGPPPRVRSRRKAKRKTKAKAKARGSSKKQAKGLAKGPGDSSSNSPVGGGGEPDAEGRASTAPSPATAGTESPAPQAGPAPKETGAPGDKPDRPARWNDAAPGKTKRALSSLLGLGVMADDE